MISGFLEHWIKRDTRRPDLPQADLTLSVADEPKAEYADHEADKARGKVGGLLAAAYLRWREARRAEAHPTHNGADSKLALLGGQSVHGDDQDS